MKNSYEAGVYGILCLINRKFYIGSGNAKKRIAAHLAKLRSGTHELPRLQEDWNEFGEAAFAFVQFPCPPSDIRRYETYLIETLQTLEHQQGYNKMIGNTWGIEASIRNAESKWIRYGKFQRLPSVKAEFPMTKIYITTLVR